jgi:hypothetical protein
MVMPPKGGARESLLQTLDAADRLIAKAAQDARGPRNDEAITAVIGAQRRHGRVLRAMLRTMQGDEKSAEEIAEGGNESR